MTFPTALADRHFSANIPDSETPGRRYRHLDTYMQLPQNHGQDAVLPATEDPSSKLMGPTNECQYGNYSCRSVRHVDRSAMKQTCAPSYGKYESGSPLSDPQKAPSRQTSPEFATLDYGERPRKRQRLQYEPIAISRYDTTGGGRSPLSHGRGSGMPKPLRPYIEQPMQSQMPAQLDSQLYQLLRSSVPEHNLQQLREPTGPSKHNSNIHSEAHDRRLRSNVRSDNSPTQPQPSHHEKVPQQLLPRSLNIPHSSGVYRPTFVGDDQGVTAWGGHPRHLRPSSNSVYIPQDSSLEGTSFHPYFELRGTLPHESRHFVPRHYLNSVDDDYKFHSQSLTSRPEPNRPSSRELPRLQLDAYANSPKDKSTPVRPSLELSKPPADENLRVDIRVEQKQEVKQSHIGSVFGQANFLVPRRYAKIHRASSDYLTPTSPISMDR